MDHSPTRAQHKYPSIDKVAFTVWMASTKLRHYFGAHKVIFLTSHPLKNMLDKIDQSDKLSQWTIELSKFEVQYKPLSAIKGQALGISSYSRLRNT